MFLSVLSLLSFCSLQAILNFDLSDYQHILDDPASYEPVASSADASSADDAGAGGAAPANTAAAVAAAAAAAAGAPQGSFFLPLLPQHQLPPGVQFGVTLSVQQPAALQYQQYQLYQLQQMMGGNAPYPAPEDQQAAAGPRLPAIRTRAAAGASGFSAPAGAPGSRGSGGQGQGSAPGSAGTAGGGGLDFSDFLLSPLAASLLSPLGLSGTPAGWRDSPLGKLASTGELGRLLSGARKMKPPISLLCT